MSTWGHYFYESHPLCSVHNPACFNLSKCSNRVLTVYANTTHGSEQAHELLDFAASKMNSTTSKTSLRKVDSYQDACLILVTKYMYNSVDEMKSTRHWMVGSRNGTSGGGGMNHVIWNLSRFRFPNTKRLSSDAPISLFHVDRAAVASESLTKAHLRPGYDLVLPLARQWGRNEAPHRFDLHRPRQWLLTFRGSIQDSQHPYYQHRWLAAEYWERASDVYVDVQCKHVKWWGTVKTTYKEYTPASIPGENLYSEMMWESTFGFAPGGSGVGSYRFGEILSTGGIPVVTHDLVLPLAPEVDWAGCVVRVSEARIIDLPRMLREIPAEQVRARQKRCWYLLQTVLGDKRVGKTNEWKSDYRVTFAKAMEVYAARVSTALHWERQVGKLNGKV